MITVASTRRGTARPENSPSIRRPHEQGNIDTRKVIERGVLDIEECLRIAEEGRQKRAEAATQLEKLETELRE